MAIVLGGLLSLVWLIVVFFFLKGYVQISRNEIGVEKSSGDVVFISSEKKCLLNFPMMITEVEIGNMEAIEAKVKENKLYLRALNKEIMDSNISIELVNGDIYGFELRYKDRPDGFVNVKGTPGVRGPMNTLPHQVIAAEEKEAVKSEDVNTDKVKRVKVTVDPGLFKEAVTFETDDEGGIHIKSANVIVNNTLFDTSLPEDI